MTTGRNLKSVLIAVVLILGTLTTASLASSLLGGNSIPSVRTVHALPGPPLLGIDCALGASADSPNPFPTPITTKDSDGVSDTSCQWAGDFDGDPAATFDPLVSDSPELATRPASGRETLTGILRPRLIRWFLIAPSWLVRVSAAVSSPM